MIPLLGFLWLAAAPTPKRAPLFLLFLQAGAGRQPTPYCRRKVSALLRLGSPVTRLPENKLHWSCVALPECWCCLRCLPQILHSHGGSN